MATIVDSLIITLGLDPANFAQGKKQALQDFIDLKEKADKAAVLLWLLHRLQTRLEVGIL